MNDLNDRMRQLSYDLRLSTFDVKKASSNIVRVVIDDRSYPADLSKSPVDRIWLAHLLSGISRLRPKAMGLNIVLDRPTDPKKDQLLAKVMANSGKIILRESYRYPTSDLFKAAAANTGTLIWLKDSSNSLQRVCNTPKTCRSDAVFHHILWDYLYPDTPFSSLSLDEDWLKINFVLYGWNASEIRTIKASEINALPAGCLKDKLVLIGIRFEYLSQDFKTPLYLNPSAGMSENEVIDQVLQMIRFNRTIQTHHPLWELVVLVVLLGVLSVVAVLRRYLIFLLLSCCFVVIWIGFSVVSFTFFNLDVPYFQSVVEIMLFFFLSVVYLLYYERMFSLRQELELEKKNLSLKQTRIEYLTKQLNTHSVFNEFSRIKGMIVADPEKARNYLVHFSNMLRYSLLYGDKESTPLANHLEFIRFYIQQQETVNVNLRFDFNIEGSTDHFSLPWNTLFILVENAVKHTEVLLNDVQKALTVTIRLRVSNEMVLFTVKNLFDDTKTVPSTKSGIKNLKDRLGLCYKDQPYSLSFRTDNMVWISELSLPAHKK